MTAVIHARVVCSRQLRRPLAIFALLMLAGGGALALPKTVVIDERSTVRTACQLEFAAVKGLVVEAEVPPSSVSGSRVNNERYAACPYDIELKFAGTTMRIDFGISFDLDSVKNYDHANPVDAGLFCL